MSLFKTIQTLIVNKLRLPERKKQLKTYYVNLSHTILVKYVVPNLNAFVKHLIVEKGLNPNYVPPTNSKPTLTTQQVEEKLNKFFLQSNCLKTSSSESWVRDSFKNISNHPIYKSRLKFESKNTIPSVTPATPVVPVVIGEPLKIILEDKDFKPPSDSMFPNKPIKKTKKVKPTKVVPTKAVVTKSFNGNFRRVDDK